MKKLKLLLLFLFVLLSSSQSLLFLGRDGSSHASTHQVPQTLSNLSNPQASSTSGVATWTNITTSVEPRPFRGSAQMVYDAADGYSVLFDQQGVTWKFLGGLWSQVATAASGPGLRNEARMVYDAADGYVFLFGGVYTGQLPPRFVRDTWRFSAGSWTNVTSISSASPPPRERHAMTYDSADGYVVLYGGDCSFSFGGCSPSSSGCSGTSSVGTTFGDTWKFSAGLWANITTSVCPGAVSSQGMAYDAADGYTILDSGFGAWRFSAGLWTLITSTAPGSRCCEGIAYDDAQSFVVLFGGVALSGYLHDTWSFAGASWTNITATVGPGPSPRFDPAIAYDTGDGYLVLYGGICSPGFDGCSSQSGGFGDTWKLASPVIPPVPPFNCEWDASSGRFPDQACPPWQAVNTDPQYVPVLSNGNLTLHLSSAGHFMFYKQSGSNISFPAIGEIQARLKVDSDTSSVNYRSAAWIEFVVAPYTGNTLYFGQDKVFLLTGPSTVGQSVTVDTHLSFHTYTITVNSTGTIHVYQDDIPILTGSTYYNTSPTDNGPVPLIEWGEGGGAAFGVSEWQVVRHNAHTTGCRCARAPPGLVGWWPGEGNGNDIVGSNNAVLLGHTSFSAAEVGQGFNFSSDVDGVTIANRADLNVTGSGFAADFWMKGIKNQPQPLYLVVDKSHGWVDFTGWAFQGDSTTGSISFFIGAGSSFPGVTSSVDVLDGNFHHVAGTWNGTAILLYVDGVLQGNAALSTPANNNRDVHLGFSWGGGTPNRFFRGIEDELQIFNRALNASEVQSIFNAGGVGLCHCVTPPTGLVSWWPGDGNANDIIGSHNGVLMNGAGFVSGKVGQAFDFNGINQFVNVTKDPAWNLGSKPFAIDLWVKFNQPPAHAGFIGQDEGPGNLNKWFFGLNPRPTDTGLLAFHINGPSLGPITTVSAPWTPNAGQWYLVAVTREASGTYTLYIDGANVASASNTTPIPNVAANLIIGAASWFLNGQIDEVQIFSRALSSSEVQAIYNAGSLGQCKPVPAFSGSGLFVANFGSNTTSVIDASTNIVVATVKVGNGPYYDVFDPFNNDVYVTNTVTNTVSVFDATSDAVVATVNVGGSPRGVGFDPSNGYVYVALTGSTVSVIDSRTNTVVTTISVGNNPYGVAFDSSNGNVYVANTGSDTVSVIDSRSNTVVASINVGAGTSPHGVAVDSSNNDIYVSNYIAGTVSVINGTTNTVVATVNVGSRPAAVAFDSSNGHVYVANQLSNTTSVIDPSSNTVVATVNVGNGPLGVAFDPANGDVYVGDSGSNTVSVISGSTNTAVATVTVGTSPIGIAVEVPTATWTQLFPTSSPPPRYFTSMASDVADGYVLLFGGENTTHVMGDTWMFKSGVWTRLSPSTSPPPRYGASMVYDAADGYVLLFGGAANGNFLSDTWEFKAGIWTQLSPASAPSPRYFVTMTYDSADGYVVLFGGEKSGVFLSDTWKFSAGTWTQLATPTSPSARCCVSMTYDAADGYVLLFGGDTSTVFGDTWTFKAGVWTQLSPSSSASPRAAAGMTYDSAQGYVLLFGGENVTSATAPRGDTWEFTAGIWIQLAPTSSPSPRDAFGLVYDSNDGYPLLFSGYNGTGVLGDTWKFGPITTVPTKATPTISSTVTPGSITIGGSASDLATVSGGSSPTGTVTYTAYSDSACAVLVFTSPSIPLGTSSASFTPSTTGTYRWIASYSGDGNDNPVSTACGAPGETLTVVPLPVPTLTTVIKDANGNPVTSIVAGALAHDSATITPTPPSTFVTGTVTYTAYSNGKCTGQPFVTPDQVTITTTGAVPDSAPGTAGAGTYSILATYSGDANNAPTASACEVLTITKAGPTITSLVSPATIAIGGSASDLAALSGGFNPSGNVTYTAYSDPACTTQVFASPNVPLGTASAAFTPSTAGTYYLVAKYNGDPSNNVVSTICRASGETLTVSKASPTLSTLLSSNSITIGNTVSDSATLTGGFQAGGTVTYSVFTNNICTAPGKIISVVPVTGGIVPKSRQVTFNSTGDFGFQASYSGDANNNAVTSSCEPLTVSTNVSIRTTLSATTNIVGGSVTDSATLAGQSATASGTVTYSDFADGTCAGPITTVSVVNVVNGMIPDSRAVTFNGTGSFSFEAVYSGDASDNSAISSCESLTIERATPHVTSTVTPPAITLGSSATDLATVSGFNPTGTITYTAYSDFSCTMSVFTSASIPLGTPSGAFTPTVAGTYYWVASYSGDSNNNAVATTCGAVGETLTVNGAPSISMVSCGHDLSCSVQSNATLTKVKFAGITIHAEAEGPKGTHGYANITVPKTAIHNIDNLHVFVDNSKLARSDVTVTSNSTDYFIYFTFTFHSPVQIDIQLTAPENAPSLILGLDPTLFYEIVGALVAVLVAIVAVAVRATRRRSGASNIPRQQ